MQALSSTKAETVINSPKPEVGRRLLKKAKVITEAISGADMVFITAMGGGSGKCCTSYRSYR